MNRKYELTQAMLWAAAILAAALVGAPTFLTLILLPSLASLSLLASRQGRRNACGAASR